MWLFHISLSTKHSVRYLADTQMLKLYSRLLWSYDSSLIRGIQWHAYVWVPMYIFGTHSNWAEECWYRGHKSTGNSAWWQNSDLGHKQWHRIWRHLCILKNISVSLEASWGLCLGNLATCVLVYTFSFLARVAVENDRVLRKYCRVFFSQPYLS